MCIVIDLAIWRSFDLSIDMLISCLFCMFSSDIVDLLWPNDLLERWYSVVCLWFEHLIVWGTYTLISWFFESVDPLIFWSFWCIFLLSGDRSIACDFLWLFNIFFVLSVVILILWMLDSLAWWSFDPVVRWSCDMLYLWACDLVFRCSFDPVSRCLLIVWFLDPGIFDVPVFVVDPLACWLFDLLILTLWSGDNCFVVFVLVHCSSCVALVTLLPLFGTCLMLWCCSVYFSGHSLCFGVIPASIWTLPDALVLVLLALGACLMLWRSSG